VAGDSRRGFAAGCVASAGFLVVGHLEGPTVYDGLAWVLVSWLVLRILRAGEERLWIAVGPTVGIGMEAKQTLPLLLVGLTVGFLLNGQRRLFSSRWLWLGALVALLGWAPNLVWQATNGWPSRAMESSLRAEHSGLGYAIKYPFITLLAMGVLIAPVWLAGAWVLWVEPRFRRYRAFAVAFTLGLVLLWVVIPDRFYYLVGIYPVLFAAGSIVTGEVVDGSRGFFRRHVAHRWLWRSRGFAIGILVVDFVVFLPLALPVLPASAVAAANLQKINYNLGEEIGWPELVHEVADVWRSLPADEREHGVILTGNYGEAGALIQYGSGYDLPTAFGGHNSFWFWGPPKYGGTTTVGVGLDRADLAPHFRGCHVAARVHNGPGVDNDEHDQPIWICTGPKASWARMWPAFKHYG
jgi:hypothetical protein